MYNFKIKNNYLLCNLPDGRVAEGFRKSVEIHATNHTSNAFISLKYLNNWDNLVIPFSEVQVDGQTLDINAFIEWATINTGNYGIEQAPAPDYTTLLQTIIDKLDLLKPLLIEIDNNTDTLETSNDAIVVNTQQIEDKLDLLKPAFEIAIELVDGANGSNVGVDFTYTIPQSIHQMSIVSEVKLGTATSIGSISANYVYSAGVLQVFSVGTMNGQYIWINGTKQ
jgi:hypothetical protein